jgi:hypothetical protein
VLTIGNRAWVAIELGRWSGATIAPNIQAGVAKGVTPSPKLIAAAKEIEAESGRQYRFTAPAQVFFGSGAGGGPTHFVAALDQHGNLLRIREYEALLGPGPRLASNGATTG